MPRKQNGFGSFKAFDLNGVNSRIDKGKKRGAAGSYPSDRRYGSSITRSAIEQFDMDSTWARWRRGMEYYYQGAYLEFEPSNAVLYQGTKEEIPVSFSGYRFATKNADSRAHYAVQRQVTKSVKLGIVEAIDNDEAIHTEQKQYREIHLHIKHGDLETDIVLLRSIGERITSGKIDANIINVLNRDGIPAVYFGKTEAAGARMEFKLSLPDVLKAEKIKENGLDYLIGKTVYLPDFYQFEQINNKTTDFIDSELTFSVRMASVITNTAVEILDNSDGLPPTLDELKSLPSIFETTNKAEAVMTAEFVFQKSDYQRFFGRQYMTADLVNTEVSRAAFAIQPVTILGYRRADEENALYIESMPFQTSLTLYSAPRARRTIVLSDNSFTKREPDDALNRKYGLDLSTAPVTLWQKMKIDIDPWYDETFVKDDVVEFATIYTCSCPAYLHAQIRSPEAYDSEGRTVNRQKKAPLPTAKGASTAEANGLLRVAGIIDSWATDRYKKGFKVCKHTIATMFADRIRVMEPNTFPSQETRNKFEEKLQADIAEVGAEFSALLERSDITTVEIIYALAEALNLDDTEIGYVIATAKS